MNEFRFAEIGWLNAAWGVLVCAGLLLFLEFRGRSLLDRMISPLMQQRLVKTTSLTRRLSSIGLLALSLLALVFALMRPQWGMTVQTMAQVQSQIMICLDVSKSMLAEDAVPNRLDRAKAEIDSLLGLMDEGQQVGLTAFAGRATVLCPMTTDFGFLRLILEEAGPGTIGLGGTRIGEALEKAVTGFGDAGDVSRMILLITDGEDHDSFPLDAADKAREKGVRVVSIGFGDEAGSKIDITDPVTGERSYVKDRNGVDVLSRLDGETLRDIAQRTEGAYIPAGTDALDLKSIYDRHIKSMLKGGNVEEERIIRNEAYQWCVLAALILFVCSLLVGSSSASRKSSAAIAPASPMRSKSGELAASWIAMLICFALASHGVAQEGAAQDDLAPGAFVTGDSAASENVSADESSAPSAEGLNLEVPEGDSLNAGDTSEAAEADLLPREIYNQAISFVRTDPDRCERLLNDARQAAGIDGELRFRALYNLGWVEVTRADAALEAEPEDALKRLELAASRFREAIRVRPESDEARQNLEVVSRRILALRDSLAKKNPEDIAQRLDAIIEMQRAHQAELQSVTSSVDVESLESNDARTQFRRLGVTQRQVLSDLQKLAEDASQEVTSIGQSQKDDEPDQAAQVRAAQLTAMLRYVESSSQRMGKARSFTRRMQSERAFVRWAAALTDAKRARDQLRDPIEVLGVLISDGTELAQLTQQYLTPSTPVLGEIESTNAPSASSTASGKPAWLSVDYLSESQLAMTQRTGELRMILEAGIQQNQAASQPDEGTPSQEPGNPELELLLKNIGQALPDIQNAEGSFGESDSSYESGDVGAAFEKQTEGIASLIAAAEYFYDLRRLIEVMYRDEQLVQMLSSQLNQSQDQRLTSALAEIQSKNLDRSQRLEELLKLERAKLQAAQSNTTASGAPPSPSPSQGVPPGQGMTPEQIKSQEQRFDQADQLLEMATSEMELVLDAINTAISTLGTVEQPAASKDEMSVEPASNKELNAEPSGIEASTGNDESELQAVAVERPPSPSRKMAKKDLLADDSEPSPPAAARKAELPLQNVELAVQHVEDLRRLFFSVVEHLRETAQRQAELNDNVAEEGGASGEIPANEAGPLANRQVNLEQISEQIAEALQKQAEESQQQPETGGADSGAVSSAPPQAGADAESLKQAADLVAEGGKEMNSAAKLLSSAASAEANGDGTTSDDPTMEPLVGESDADSDSVPPEVGDSAAETSVPGNEEPESSDSPVAAVVGHQRAALQKLLEALALLDQQQSGEDQQQNDQQDQQQNEQQQQQEQQNQQQQNMNANQMLQAIRDREAKRRKEKQTEAVSSGGVEKDW